MLLETVSRVAPLGVSFRDEATGDVVADGLQVSAWPEGQPSLRRESKVNRSGVHVFMDLPGLRALEGGAGDAAYWSTLTGRKPFTIEVVDTLGRFQPCSFRAELPHRGPLGFDAGSSPPAPTPSVPLFSAPARQAASTLASLRAELWDTQAQAPAAWALVEATPTNGSRVRGIADAQGRVALFFAYPPPVELAVAPKPKSPPLPTTRPLLEQEWTVRLRVRYAPRGPLQAPPDLEDTLAQPAASVGTNTSQWQPHVERTLRYGQALVVKTQDAPRSQLWIKPVGFPP
jgi:hypothetical protein